MSLSADLDAWAAEIGTATGIPATRDPGAVFPPCVYVGSPTATLVTVGDVIALNIPVWLVGPSPGNKANLDTMLDLLPTFYGYGTPDPIEARPETLSIDSGDFPAYAVTYQRHFAPTTP